MTYGYLYRNDHLNLLRGQAADPSLRARRIRQQPEAFPHHQIGRALDQAQAGQGVFRLSMWRGLEWALTDLWEQLRMVGTGLLPPNGPLVLQRIRADHRVFQKYQRDDDEYLAGQAWLFWNTESCPDSQDWSTDGIAHDDIEVFHPSGTWMPYRQWVTTAHNPPQVDTSWKRIELPPAAQGAPMRFLEARWVDFPVAEDRIEPGIFARVPTWSPAVWPSDWATLQELTPALVDAFPQFLHEGVLRMALERQGERLHYEGTVVRTPARRPSWIARMLLSASESLASVSLTDAHLVSKAAGRLHYGTAGLDPESFTAAAYIYSRESIAILER